MSDDKFTCMNNGKIEPVPIPYKDTIDAMIKQHSDILEMNKELMKLLAQPMYTVESLK